MPHLPLPTDDDIFETILREAHVGPARVAPSEIGALLDRLEDWLESAAVRRAARRTA